eukprot:1467458-Pleurochrysis_carterae.AAC.1
MHYTCQHITHKGLLFLSHLRRPLVALRFVAAWPTCACGCWLIATGVLHAHCPNTTCCVNDA